MPCKGRQNIAQPELMKADYETCLGSKPEMGSNGDGGCVVLGQKKEL